MLSRGAYCSSLPIQGVYWALTGVINFWKTLSGHLARFWETAGKVICLDRFWSLVFNILMYVGVRIANAVLMLSVLGTVWAHLINPASLRQHVRASLSALELQQFGCLVKQTWLFLVGEMVEHNSEHKRLNRCFTTFNITQSWILEQAIILDIEAVSTDVLHSF